MPTLDGKVSSGNPGKRDRLIAKREALGRCTTELARKVLANNLERVADGARRGNARTPKRES